jgi:hypothetical protein
LRSGEIERAQNSGEHGKLETWQGGAFRRPHEPTMMCWRALGADTFQAAEP